MRKEGQAAQTVQGGQPQAIHCPITFHSLILPVGLQCSQEAVARVSPSLILGSQGAGLEVTDVVVSTE